MIRHILRRVILAIPTLLGVTLLTFTLTNILPGDPARALAGRYATPEMIKETRERLGLDRPLYVQYVRYMGNLVRGDWGQSFSSRASVAEELVLFYPPSLELALVAMALAVAVGVPLGVWTGTGRSPWVNSSVMFFSLMGVGMPVFWAGLLFQLVFFGKLQILPLSGRLGIGVSPPPAVTHMYTVDALLAGQWATFVDALHHMILPALTLAMSAVASVTRITHAAMVEVMRNDYIRTARAKGLRERLVLGRHALKNALLPIVTTVAMQTGWLLGGSLLVEIIFTWGGLGTYAWRGILMLDIPVIMGVSLVTTTTFIVLNLLADITYCFLDPRIAYG
jgi:peptide/nickel transport system permease protein